MSDVYTETETTSWGSRILGSLTGALVGIAFFLGSFVLLWWGEGRSIERSHTLDEGRGLVISIAADKMDPANNGRLVHFSGMASSDETLQDSEFGVEEKALKLMRDVEMYQWKEESSSKSKENLGGSETTETTYTYKKEWSSDVIDSSDFKQPDDHVNPDSMDYQSKNFVASDIHVNAFHLTKPFVEQLNDSTAYPLTQAHYDAMDDAMKESFSLHKGELITSKDPEKPEIGDIRVRYTTVAPGEVSIIGKQSDTHIETYPTSHGSIELVEMGDMDANAMFASAASENALLTWAIRLGGILLMAMGIGLVLRPIRMLGAVVPFIGGLLGAGIGLISMVVALGLGTLTIALAWLFYRPVIGITILLIGAGLTFGGLRMIKQKLAARKTATS